MSQYFAASFFIEAGFPSKIAFQEYEKKEPKKAELVTNHLSKLVAFGKNIVKDLYSTNENEILKLDNDRKRILNQQKQVRKVVKEKYEPIDLSDDEITSFQPVNREANLEIEIQNLTRLLNDREAEIAELHETNSTLRNHYKMLKNAYVEVTIQFETLRRKIETPFKRTKI